MRAPDVNSLFARAEQAFVEGRLDAARADILEVQRLAGGHPAVLHLFALVEKKRGATQAAAGAFRAALRLAPNDPQINNNFATLLDQLGEPEAALAAFDRALAAVPGFVEARYNRALLLQRLGRLNEALAELDRVLGHAPATAKLHSARASVLRQLGKLDQAIESYDAALRIEPKRAAALHGRARTAMERGDEDASDHYRRALNVMPDDPTVRLGLAEALEGEGKPGAVDVLAAAVAAQPLWTEGQAALARMRWEAGEGTNFTRGFERALEAVPQDRKLWLAYASALAAADLAKESADAAARAREAVGEDSALQLLEAVHASEAGELERADRLFAGLPPQLPGRSIHEVRHLIRRKRFDDALKVTERSRREDEWNVGAWALTGLLWRITGDARAAWLHEQPGLVASKQLALSASEIEQIADRIRGLHRTRSHPIGQSLRGGTQTRGLLFGRAEPEIRRLAAAVGDAVEAYWEALPPADRGHPLLRHRNARPRLAGSWSVRLTGGGFHVAHIHSEGIVSSACYLLVPPPSEDREGWLEIGRPPADLGLTIDPLVTVDPRPGRIVLFPSTLYHGTRPFRAGERLTVAFDVVVA